MATNKYGSKRINILLNNRSRYILTLLAILEENLCLSTGKLRLQTDSCRFALDLSVVFVAKFLVKGQHLTSDERSSCHFSGY